jgi:lysozyme
MNRKAVSAIGITLASIMGVATYYGTGDDFIKHHEGEVLHTYKDPVNIDTICSGHTGEGVKLQQATESICKELRGRDMAVAYAALERHVKVNLQTPERGLALVSFVFNVGEGNFARSTLLKKLNAGDTRGACNELMRWQFAGGKPLHGLAIRRADERALCLHGVQHG